MQTNQNQNTETALATKKENFMEYVPIGSIENIKLTPKIVADLLCKPSKKGYLCSIKDAQRFMMLCQARHLNPFAGDAFLVGYDNYDGKGAEFSMITAHVAVLKCAESSPHYDGMESGVILQIEEELSERQGDFFLPPEKLVGAWARVTRKDQKIPTYRRVNFSSFAKDNKFWNGNPGGMIVKCAEADALRSAFPNLAGGLYIKEEIDIRPADITSIETIPAVEHSVTVLPTAAPESTPTAPEDDVPMGDTKTPSKGAGEVCDYCNDKGISFYALKQWALKTGLSIGADRWSGWESLDQKAVEFLQSNDCEALKSCMNYVVKGKKA